MSRRQLLIITATIVIVIILASYFIYSTWYRRTNTSTTIEVSVPRSAIIYDSLYREYPNPEVIENVTRILREHNVTVKVYLGKDAGLIPLYSLNKYDLVIFRSHGGYNSDPSNGMPLGAYIFTGIHFDEAVRTYGDIIFKYHDERYIVKGVIPPPNIKLTPEVLKKLPRYVVLSPWFFRDKVPIKRGSIIVFFGCYGLDDDRLAEVFLEKGARAFISWRGNITWTYMDEILDDLVALLLKYFDKPEKAVEIINEVYGPDPATNAALEIKLRTSSS